MSDPSHQQYLAIMDRRKTERRTRLFMVLTLILLAPIAIEFTLTLYGEFKAHVLAEATQSVMSGSSQPNE